MNSKKKKGINHNIIWAVISALLAILTVRVVLKQNKDMSLSELAEVIKASKISFLFLGMISSALFIWFEGVALRSILKHAGYPRSVKQGLLYTTSDLYFSAITPSATGGQPASGFFMMRDGIPGGMATAVLMLNLMMYTISIVFLGAISSLISPGAFGEFGQISRVLIAVGYGALSLLSIIFFILLKKEDLIFKPLSGLITFLCDKHLLRGKEKKLAKINKIRDDYARCSAVISGRKRVLFTAFLWNCLQRGFQMIIPSLTFYALGGEAGKMVRIFTKQCLVTIGYNFIPVPGGMGVSDFLMIDGFHTLMSPDMAFNVELISRSIMFYVCIAVSGVFTLIGYLWGCKKLRKKASEGEAEGTETQQEVK